VQTPRVIDALYTQGGDDADEALLGLAYSASDITASVWAPTAKQVNLKIYTSAKALHATEAMVFDNTTGIWSFSTPITNDRLFYRYELNVYHPQNLAFETIETTDPYSVSLSTNGVYSQFVNLMDADLKPAGWGDHVIPMIADPEDAVIYEGHIRDFSVLDSSTSSENRGKYLAFTEQNSSPVMHLKSLVAAGLTHFQFLPANDIASINEGESTRVNITDTVADLCAVDSSASVCGSGGTSSESNPAEDMASTLLSVFESYEASSDKAQALAQSLRGLDSFNWGYDPKHFSTPDGSYASNADGVARIIEMRTMNKALHEMGLRVVLDVVYNHTNSSGLWEHSVLDKVVPGYYHRRDLTSGNVLQETCCQDTAPEHKMMDKLMQDSLVMWTKEYKFDGFRFDIMSNNSVDSIIAARIAVQAIDSENYFYGEGWTRSEQGYTQAQQNNMAGTQVGTFNDRPRDTIRGATFFGEENKFSDQDTIRLGLAGTLEDYQLQDQSGRINNTFAI
jgi:pullulanase